MATAATQTMDKRWYIVHAYSNFEKKVAESIREQAKQRGLDELFEQVLVPIAMCVALAAVGVWFVARQLNQAAVK